MLKWQEKGSNEISLVEKTMHYFQHGKELMNLDSHAIKGNSHDVLQDATLHFETEKYAGIIVSDGCSSSPKSEIGANLLPALFKESFLESRCFEESPQVQDVILKSALRNKILEIIRHTGFDLSVFDATLVSPVIDKTTMMGTCFVWGDGYVVLTDRDKEQEIFEFNYSRNAPYYFGYELDSERKADYHKLFGDGKAIMKVKSGGTFDVEQLYSFHIQAFDLVNVSIFSDGILTFYRDCNGINQLIPVETVIKDLTSFKGYTGEFVKRRVLRYLRDAEKQGIKHWDDISMGCINFI